MLLEKPFRVLWKQKDGDVYEFVDFTTLDAAKRGRSVLLATRDKDWFELAPFIIDRNDGETSEAI